MKLTENFTLEEFTFSDTALRLGIDNGPGPTELNNLRKIAALMESIRLLLGGRPIRVHSGFRCPTLNDMVGGSKSSVHMLGLACDFTCIEYGSPYLIATLIKDQIVRLPAFDQCILEYGWVHLGLPRPYSVARAQFLTKRSAHSDYQDGIVA